MTGGTKVLIVVVAVVVVLALFLIGIYNKLVALRNRFKNAFAQIDVQLKRRYDLIPNLVETAKGYMAHERWTLEAVIAARNQAVNANQAAAASRNPMA
jgi:LemA protein